MRFRYTVCSLAVALAATAVVAPPHSGAASPELVDRAVVAGISLSSTNSYDVTAVDYDLDGDTDLAMSLHFRAAGQLRRNNADGTFTRIVTSTQTSNIMPRPNALGGLVDRHGCTWADFDRSGLPDAYCTAGRLQANRYKTDAIDNELWLQTATGVFTDRAGASGVGEPCSRGRQTAALDVNSDGWPDLFAGAQKERADAGDPCNLEANYPYNEQSKIFINRGADAAGTWQGFRFGTEWSVRHANAGAGVALPLDYNRDGRTDLLAGTFAGQPAFLYRNTGTGFVEVARAGTVSVPLINGATLADLTRDGIQDLVYADNTGFAYRAGTATGISTATVRIGTVPSGARGWTVAVGDINGDGLLDVYGQVGSSSATGNPDDYVFVRQTSGSWQRYVAPSATGGANDVAAVEVAGRSQFLVLNGGEDGEEFGAVQLIAWR